MVRLCSHIVLLCSPQLSDLQWGYLEMTCFSSHEMWPNIKPLYLALRSAGKMDKVGAKKHLAGIFNHRNPIRGAFPILGLYTAFQMFSMPFVSAWPLASPLVCLFDACRTRAPVPLMLPLATHAQTPPSMEDAIKTMHERPLIRNQSGGEVDLGKGPWNGFLREHLASDFVGAKHSNFTLHGIRNQISGEAREEPKADEMKIQMGESRATGSVVDNYKGCVVRLLPPSSKSCLLIVACAASVQMPSIDVYEPLRGLPQRRAATAGGTRQGFVRVLGTS